MHGVGPVVRAGNEQLFQDEGERGRFAANIESSRAFWGQSTRTAIRSNAWETRARIETS